MKYHSLRGPSQEPLSVRVDNTGIDRLRVSFRRSQIQSTRACSTWAPLGSPIWPFADDNKLSQRQNTAMDSQAVDPKDGSFRIQLPATKKSALWRWIRQPATVRLSFSPSTVGTSRHLRQEPPAADFLTNTSTCTLLYYLLFSSSFWDIIRIWALPASQDWPDFCLPLLPDLVRVPVWHRTRSQLQISTSPIKGSQVKSDVTDWDWMKPWNSPACVSWHTKSADGQA